MEQFSLEKYLENPNREIVTRDGRPVRILDYNLKGDKCICIAVDDKTQESITTVDVNGHCLIDGNGWHESNFDLFFADEERGLTEFEKAISEFIQKLTFNGNVLPSKDIKGYAKSLLDLARKKILKDLPKWKNVSGKNGAGTKDYKIVGYYLVKDNYAIYLEDLEKLPKE